jgi:bacterioferritin
MSEFTANLEEIRKRARASIEEGAVTSGYKADREQVVKVLNEALATEIVCWLRYKRHFYSAKGLASDSVKAEFLEHATQEEQHADWLAERIGQLGGEPDFNPRGLTERSHADYAEGGDLRSMIRENLVAERIAIDVYSEIIRWLGDDDPTTRKLIVDILKEEEEHANDMADLLTKVS